MSVPLMRTILSQASQLCCRLNRVRWCSDHSRENIWLAAKVLLHVITREALIEVCNNLTLFLGSNLVTVRIEQRKIFDSQLVFPKP